MNCPVAELGMSLTRDRPRSDTGRFAHEMEHGPLEWSESKKQSEFDANPLMIRLRGFATPTELRDWLAEHRCVQTDAKRATKASRPSAQKSGIYSYEQREHAAFDEKSKNDSRHERRLGVRSSASSLVSQDVDRLGGPCHSLEASRHPR